MLFLPLLVNEHGFSQFPLLALQLSYYNLDQQMHTGVLDWQ